MPEVYDRGYWFNLADPGLPFFMLRRVAAEIPLGQRSWASPVGELKRPYNWAGAAPSTSSASKLMWDVDTDVDALLNDYYTKFFGPAAKPMQNLCRDHGQRRD